MARSKDPKAIAAKYARNSKNAVQDYKDGVSGVTVAPGQAAVAKQEKFRANLLASIDDGTWAENTAAVPLQTWQKAAIGKGAQNYTGGIDAAVPKVERAMADILAAQDQIKRELDAMPNNTPEERIARALFQMRAMHEFKGTIGK